MCAEGQPHNEGSSESQGESPEKKPTLPPHLDLGLLAFEKINFCVLATQSDRKALVELTQV